jgi:TolB protein
MRLHLTVAAAALCAACGHNPETGQSATPSPAAPPAAPAELQNVARAVAPQADEPRLANLRMLTDGGENAEAYFSADARRLIFQATRPGVSECDQIFTMNVDGSNVRMVSTGRGRTTCAYFFPSGDRILYSSTHEHSPACPPPPDRSQGYVWGLDSYDIFTANPDGSDLRRITSHHGYDAEATISPDGSRIVFTSTRDGDIDIYTMNADGSDVRRLTDDVGYDGGPFFSPDGTRIVYRAAHARTPEEIAEFRRLLALNVVRAGPLDIMLMDADGSNKRRVVSNGAANFAPFMHPDGQRIIFSSNMADPRGRNFDLWIVSIDGTGLERVTTHPDFDGFPMFSPDGTRLVFASNRDQTRPGETNIFIADWRD